METFTTVALVFLQALILVSLAAVILYFTVPASIPYVAAGIVPSSVYLTKTILEWITRWQ